ncbi:MAG: hypothetical protein J0I98_16010 [Mesorhizobium sp.]|nr:hypothetical protein [Mesorhizobium sp.]MBN9244291.1 hypothetical protein [Mesorhizobium sp.]
MLDFGKIREKEKGLLQRKAKLEADLARLRTQGKKAARRDDTRRKIVLGGVILAAIEADDIRTDFVAGLVRTHITERDKKLFAGSAFADPEVMDSGGTESRLRE